jgi:hypothetical protein
MNLAMGGGFRIGRLHVVTGWEITWKTGLLISTIANAQKQGKLCSWLDIEHRLEEELARKSGVDTSKLIIPPMQPDGNEVMKYVMTMASANEETKERIVDVTVIDSITRLVDRYMLDRDFGKETQGHRAKKTNEYIDNLTALMAPMDPKKPSDITVFAVTTRYDKLDQYASPKGEQRGGHGIRYQAGNSVYLTRKYYTGTAIGSKPTEDPYRVKTYNSIGDTNVKGMMIEWHIDKGSIGLAERGRCHVAIRPMPELGLKTGEVDRVLEVVSIACRMGTIESSGSSYKILGEKVSGYANLIKRARKIYTEDPEAWKKLENEIKSKYYESIDAIEKED